MQKDGFDLVRCERCALVFVHPQPTLEYLRTKVYSAESGFQAGRAQDLSRVPPQRRYRAMFDLACAFRPNARLLDVGAGGGHFLFWALRAGFTGAGVELNTRLADSARTQGLVMYAGTLDEAGVPAAHFDIVVMGEVIEHVNDPRQLIRGADRALAPNGALLITTPNLDCFWSRATFVLWKFFNIPWSSVTPPYHLFQFSVKNLDLLLEQEGYTRSMARYLPPPTLRYELGSLHLLKRFKASRNAFDLLFLVFAFALYTPLHTIARVIHPLLSKDFSMLHVYTRSNENVAQ
jgi:2-polyprenyl-3-methyl-5-hydroxy-6-metoxy-1,4-benzoquinol methylase